MDTVTPGQNRLFTESMWFLWNSILLMMLNAPKTVFTCAPSTSVGGVAVPCDEGNGAERRTSFENGRKLLLQKDKGTVEYVLDSSGDSNSMHLVSCPNHWGEWRMTDGTARITMLVRTLCCIFGSWFEAPITVLPEVARTRTCVVQVDGLLVSLALWQNELVTRRIHYLPT